MSSPRAGRHRVYIDAVEDAFGADVDYGMLTKLYGDTSEGEKRYSPAECMGIRRTVVEGNPKPEDTSTSYVERHGWRE